MPVMPQKKHKPEEIVAKLRQVDVLLSEGRPVTEAIRTISVFTYYIYGRLSRCKSLSN
jgi:putative transposase